MITDFQIQSVKVLRQFGIVAIDVIYGLLSFPSGGCPMKSLDGRTLASQRQCGEGTLA